MKDILAEIVEKKRDLVAEAKRRLPFAELKARARERCGGFYVTKRFQARDWNLIAECKLQSPAKGRLCRTHTVDELARIYAENGASMLSVHTDPHFLGANEDLVRVRSLVDLPLLRKDFIIDPYQIYESRYLGADAVLLIAAALNDAELAHFTRVAHDLGLDVLVEVHDEAECERALKLPLRVIGVNNRNLHDFSVSLDTSKRIKAMLPPDYLLVCESGIHSRADIDAMQAAGIHAFLVGGALMQADDPGAALTALLAPAG